MMPGCYFQTSSKTKKGGIPMKKSLKNLCFNFLRFTLIMFLMLAIGAGCRNTDENAGDNNPSAGQTEDNDLTLKSVSPIHGVTGQDLQVSLTGTGFDENTKVSMYPDSGNKRMIIGSADILDDYVLNSVVVWDGKAYAASRYGPFYVIDTDNPEAPVIIGSVEISGYDAAISDGKAYLAGDSGFYVIDIGISENPVIIASVEILNCYGVTVSDGMAYVTGQDGLYVIDVSNPETPVIIGLADEFSSFYYSSVAVSDGKAYVAGGYIGWFYVLDVSIPENPFVISTIKTPGFPCDVAVSDGKAYTAFANDPWSSLAVIDISNPENPAIIGSADLPGFSSGISVSGGKAYVADGHSGFQMIDISNPENPVIIGAVSTPGSAYDVAVSDGKAYIAGGGGFYVIEIGTPETPVTIDSGGFVKDVTVSDGKAYVVYGNACLTADEGFTAYFSGNGFQVADISNPETPVIIGAVEIPAGVANDGTVAEGKAYVVCGNSPLLGDDEEWSGIYAIDISNPENPVIIGSLETPASLYSVNLSDGKAYAAYENEDQSGIYVIDIGNPENPVIIESLDPVPDDSGELIQDSVISDGIAYVPNGHYGLKIVPVPLEISAVTVHSETEISLTLPGPKISGHYTLKVFNETESDELPGALNFVAPN
jgi:hypothetical protein